MIDGFYSQNGRERGAIRSNHAVRNSCSNEHQRARGRGNLAASPPFASFRLAADVSKSSPTAFLDVSEFDTVDFLGRYVLHNGVNDVRVCTLAW
jgi:hypothetical protein